MKIGEIPPNEIGIMLKSPRGLTLEVGPFKVRVKTRNNYFPPFLQKLYPQFPVLECPSLSDFHVFLDTPVAWRRFIRPQVIFRENGDKLFEPFPANMCGPLFEWGWNWCIGTRAHQYLILHSAVIEKNGIAVIMPAYPGSGKSTLCAALMLSGWRLLSDEFGLIRCDGGIDPIPRPIPLKNQSISVIRDFSTDAVIGPLFPKTRKGTVAHLAPTERSVKQMKKPATAAYIIFPKFHPKTVTALKPVKSSYALMKLATNAFNYEVLGAEGFKRVARLIRQCECYNFSYSKLEEALPLFDSLVS